jgi:predicted MFS family arabinose efflux permease
MAVRSSFGALRDRQFRLLWLGRTASSVGDSLIPVALAFAVIEETGSATDLGFVLAAFSVARVVLIVVGGVWADRLPRRVVMVGADVVRTASQGLLAVVLIADSAEIWHLAVAGAVGGGAQAFFAPASTGFVPDTVSAGRLQQANALISVSDSATGLFGPALSGVLVAAVGPGWVFAIDAGSFAVSALFLAAIRAAETPAEERQPFVREVIGGLREIAARRWLAASLVSFALANISLASYFVLGPLVVERELGGARDLGLVLTGGAAGGVLGGLLALRLRPARPLLVGNLVLLLESAALLALIPPLSVFGLAVAASLSFLSVAFFNALWETVLQEQVPRRALSRVSSLDMLVSFIFMPLGFTIAGPLSEAIGVDATLAAASALTVVAVLFPVCFASVRELRRSPWLASGSAGESPVPVPLDPLP